MKPDIQPPLVSVVTAALDPPIEKFERCLESVRRQSYPNIEHVIVDGGSTNGALEVLSADQTLNWVSEPDRGQTDAVNKGLFERSNGDFLIWLNADDVLYEDSTEHAVTKMIDDPSIGWVYGNLDVDTRGRRHVIHPPEVAELSALDFNNVCLIAPGTAFSRAALEKAGPMDISLNIEMDLDLSLKLLKAGVRGEYTPRSLALLEIFDGTKTGETPKRDIVAERHRIYLNHGMFQQAGAALALAGRYELHDEIDRALEERRFGEASRIAARGLRFMPGIFERHRISFWLTRLFPRAMRLIKNRLGRF